MSHSTRFIMAAVAGWMGLRAVSLGMVPGSEALAFDRAPAPAAATALPPIAATQFPPLDPVAPAAPAAPYPAAFPATGQPYANAYPAAYPGAYPTGYPAPYPPAYPRYYPAPYPVAYPVPFAAGMSRAAVERRDSSPAQADAPDLPTRWGPAEAEDFSLAPAAERYAAAGAPLDQWPLAAIAGGRSSPAARRAQTPAEMIRAMPGIDRLSMTGWAMMRRDPGSPSLAANGQLGGSQAGARILWRFRRDLALSLRSSAPVGGVQRTAEFAAGLRWQPLASIPIALTAERRQSFGPDKGPPAFALFAEGGVYDRPLLAGFNLDAYLQGGVVGARDRALFVDGAATFTRPLWSQLSAGFGAWGGAQPGLARLDVGPRLTWRIGSRMRANLDYRQRVLGQAAPGSGPVLSLGANF